MTIRCLWLALGAAALATIAWAADSPPAAQDSALLRFAERAVAYYPDSVFRITSNERGLTASGSYRLVDVERVCASDALSGTTALVVDDVADSVWLGSAAKLPDAGIGGDPAALRTFLEQFLPQALQGSLRIRVTALDWSDPPVRADGVWRSRSIQ